MIDYAGREKREPVPFGHQSAEGRAFIPIDRDGPVMLYHLARTAYRDGERRILLGQLRFAKPVDANRRPL